MSGFIDAWRWAGLGGVLLIAVCTDWRHGRIPNKALLFGLIVLLIAVTSEAISGPSGSWSAFRGVGLGLVGGFFLSLPFYLLRLLGAGDVKLLAVVGAFVGWPAIGSVAVLSLLLNGLASVLIAMRHGVLPRLLVNVWRAGLRAAFWLSSGGAPRDAVKVETTGYRMPHALGVALAVLMYVDQRWIEWLRS